MELAQSHTVTDDVVRLAALSAGLAGVPAALNESCFDVHAGPMPVGFTEYHRCCPAAATGRAGDGALDRRPETILYFLVDDVDAGYERIKALGVEWVMPPATQPRETGTSSSAIRRGT